MRPRRPIVPLIALLLAGCASSEPSSPSREALLDPKGCAQCHPNHYRDWASSLHAYASDDPVMLAQNALGQRLTKGALGDFCMKCHAPMAVREGATADGLNMAAVPQQLKGVTCFFCHTVDAVERLHNNSLHQASDPVMRGSFGNSKDTPGHRSQYSVLHDRDRVESSDLCGGCHDLRLGGLALERTHAEWKGTVFASAPGGATCGQCHMRQSDQLEQIAQVPGAPLRRSHDHHMPALDVSLTSPSLAAVQRPKIQALLDTTLQSALCVGAGGSIDVVLENVAAGHSWPSGGAQHRRAWVELVAWSKGEIVYQSGVVPPGRTLASVRDPDRWEMRECLLDEGGKETLNTWETASYESYTLEGLQTFDVRDPRYYQTHVFQRFPRASAPTAMPDRVTMRVRVQPIALEILDQLIASGDLDPNLRDRMPTFDTAAVEWTPESAKVGYYDGAVRYSCVSKTNLNYAGDRWPAPRPVKCAP